MSTKIPIFKQITSLIDNNILRTVINKYQANKYKKSITFTSYFYTLIFSQLANLQSLRDISHILRGIKGFSNHMGIQKVPSKSSISYFNANTPWQIFKDIYDELRHTYAKQLKISPSKLKIKTKITILDSSVITLCASIFNWAKYTSIKGAVRLHTGLDYDTLLPEYLDITDGKVGEPQAIFLSSFEKHSVVIADRGYRDTKLFKLWEEMGVNFIVRTQGPHLIFSETVRELELPEDASQSILLDEVVRFSGPRTKSNYTKEIRRVVIYNAENGTELNLMTNNFSWTAEEISELYKARWSIEEFFKELKQGLNVKSFLGTSANAVQIQIWCAMIVLLLLRIMKKQSQAVWYMSNLITFIRMVLFQHDNLTELLDTVGRAPPKSKINLEQSQLFS